MDDYVSDYKNIVVKIGKVYYNFYLDSIDFADAEVKKIYDSEQIYINIAGKKVSHNFLEDYRKLKNKGTYFEIDTTNLFVESEKKIVHMLNDFFLGDCLDVGCGDSLYKNIFLKKDVNYLGIDIHKVNTELKIIESSFEDYSSIRTFDVIFFFRSINHFQDTKSILDKAYQYLKPGGKVFIVENQAFGELKLSHQIFESKEGDYEHFFNYSLENFKKLVNFKKFSILKEEGVRRDTANQWYILLKKNENTCSKS